jgi:hypothetical protein
MWVPTAEASTPASEDARPELVASPSPTLEPSTRQRRQLQVLAGASKLAELVIVRLDSLLTFSAITIGTLKGHSTLTAVHQTRSRYMVRPT